MAATLEGVGSNRPLRWGLGDDLSNAPLFPYGFIPVTPTRASPQRWILISKKPECLA